MQIICPNCQTENPENARFCFNCGHSLAGVEASSTATDSPGDVQSQASVTEQENVLERFIPREFADKLDAARDSRAMEGERRTVTMLFCDVQGSTAAAGQLDPEEWTEIINGAFEYMIRPIYRYEGTVARLTGDGILAFFGAPIAHEDDPQRAILAGLDIISGFQDYRQSTNENWQLAIDVRVGINTGLVVVGAVGSDLRMEYTAMGDAINLAARMEQTAAPGTVQVAYDTYRRVAPIFDFEDLGHIDVKGKDEPVDVYRALRSKVQPGRLRGVEGLASPLVGRDAELHRLRGAIIALRQGEGQIVSITGEAGLGKTRLVTEVCKAPTPVSGVEAQLYWLQGRSLSYEMSSPFAPFIGLLTECFGLDDVNPDEGPYARLKAHVAELAPGREDGTAPFLASLLKLDVSNEDAHRVIYLDPPQLRAGIFEAVKAYFEALAQKHPLVLVFDDIHWIDPTSLMLLLDLLPLTDRAPLMIVVVLRPVQNEPAWKFHEIAQREFGDRYTAIMLDPLDDVSSRDLVANLLKADGLPREVRDLILGKADGNPFYVEEVIRSLLDSGSIVQNGAGWRMAGDSTQIKVPDSLTAVITARLDQLDDEDRRVLQTASVIGREFRAKMLASIYDESQPLEPVLAELQRRDLVRVSGSPSQPLYMFKHALTQETAYDSLLLRRRRELHASAATYLEEHEPSLVADIGRHFVTARLPKRALPYLVEAGERAAHAYATKEAIGYFEQALKILETVDDLSLVRRAYEGLGSALTFANELSQAVETYETMLEQGNVREDGAMQVSALNKLSLVAALRLGQFDQAEEYLVEADRRAREHDDLAGLSEMSLVRCIMCTAIADFEGVIRYMDQLLQLGHDLSAQSQVATALAHIASSFVYMLKFEDAWKTAQEGLALTQEINDREQESDLRATTVAFCHLRNGDLEAALESATAGAKMAQEIGFTPPQVVGCWTMGHIARIQGDYGRALELFQRCVDAARPAELVWGDALGQCLLGALYLEISPAFLARTEEYHEQAEPLLEHPVGALMGASAWLELGYHWIAAGKLDDAEVCFRRGLTIPTTSMQLEEPRLLVGLADVAQARGDYVDALQRLADARSIVEEHAMQNLMPLISFAEARVSAAMGESALSLAQFSHAEKAGAAMNMRPLLWRISAGKARVLESAGCKEDAAKARASARSTIDEIVSLFEDEAMAAKFVEHAHAQL